MNSLLRSTFRATKISPCPTFRSGKVAPSLIKTPNILFVPLRKQQLSLYQSHSRVSLVPILSQIKQLRHLSTKKSEPPLKKNNTTAISRYHQFIASTSTSFLDTIKLSLKWLLIKQNRPFNADDMSAFISWFVWSNILWFVLGTTTFVSIVLYAMKSIGSNNQANSESSNNASFLDTFILKILFRYNPEKISISFVNNVHPDASGSFDDNTKPIENIKPSIRDGVITLNNLRIHSKDSGDINNNNHEKTTKLSKTDNTQDPGVKLDILISRIDLTLDFTKWYHGKGLVNTLYIDGIQGVIENNVTDSDLFEIENSDEENSTLPESNSQQNAIMELVGLFNNNSDYEFGKIKIRNMNMIYSSINNGYEQIDLQIFNWDLKKLRMKWILFDLLKTKICSGTINNALFTIHQKQLQTQSNILIQKFTDFSKNDFVKLGEEIDENNDSETNMNSITRIQVNSINLKTNPLLKKNFNWLIDGKANIICDINIPSENHFQLADLFKEFASNFLDTEVDINMENLISSAKSFIRKNESQLVTRSSSFNECFSLFDVIDFNNIDQSINMLSNNPSMVNSSKESDETQGKSYKFRMVPDKENSNVNKLIGLSSSSISSHLDEQPFPRKMQKKNGQTNNRYIIVDLKLQFVNCIAKMPVDLPFCRKKEMNYIGYDELRRIVNLINGNNEYGYGHQYSSFFSKKNRSILSNVNNNKKYYHYSTNNKNLCVISNDAEESDSDDIYGKSTGNSGSQDEELIDRQFTLRSSSIFKLDDLYGKVSFSSDTDILDQCVSDLYDDLIKNLHHEIQTRFRFR